MSPGRSELDLQLTPFRAYLMRTKSVRTAQRVVSRIGKNHLVPFIEPTTAASLSLSNGRQALGALRP